MALPWEETDQYIRSGHRSPENHEPHSFRAITLGDVGNMKTVIGKSEEDEMKMQNSVEKADGEPLGGSEGNTKHIFLSLDVLQPPGLGIRVDSLNDVDGLAESVANDGVLEPLIVRPSRAKAGYYEVVCGLRRFYAAKKAGLKAVPCIVKELNDCEAMEAMLVENMERTDLSDYEVGRWFKLLMEKFPDKYPDLQTVAGKFGYKDVAIVSRLISHYEFIEKVAGSLPPKFLPRGKMLPEGFIREVRRAPEDLQPKIVRALINAQLRFERGEAKYAPGVRDVAELVDSYIRDWERERKPEVAEKEREAKAKATFTIPAGKPEVAPPEVPILEKPTAIPTKPTIPSEREVEVHLEETVRRRREEKAKEQSKFASALYKYYPEKFLVDIEKFFDLNAPEERVLEFINYVIELAWDKLSDAVKMEVIREARSWML